MLKNKFLIMCCFVGLLNASDVVETYESGSINWSENIVTAKGVGYSNKSNKVIAYKMAQRASKLDAMRNLLEIVGKVRIDSHTTIKNKMAQDDSISSAISGNIRNIIDVKYVKLDNNSVESTIKMKLEDKVVNKLINDSSDLLETKSFKGTKATGVIVDARGLKFKPSLNPKIVQEYEGVLYPDKVFIKSNSSNKFIAIFLRDIDVAMSHPLVGKFPLVIKAKSTVKDNNGQLLLNKENSDKLKQEIKIDALQNGKVIIVVN